MIEICAELWRHICELICIKPMFNEVIYDLSHHTPHTGPATDISLLNLLSDAPHFDLNILSERVHWLQKQPRASRSPA